MYSEFSVDHVYESGAKAIFWQNQGVRKATFDRQIVDFYIFAIVIHFWNYQCGICRRDYYLDVLVFINGVPVIFLAA